MSYPEHLSNVLTDIIWAGVADRVVFYVDYGYSRGMKDALEWHTANLNGQIVERRIGKNSETGAEGGNQAATPGKGRRFGGANG